MKNISDLIKELVIYGKDSGLIADEDIIYCTNKLLEFLKVDEYAPTDEISEGSDSDSPAKRRLHLILEDMTDYAIEKRTDGK